METKVRPFDWCAHFFRVKHREAIPGIAEWDDRLIEYLVDVLGLESDARILDVACGSGVHLARLAHRGIVGLGIDLAPSLIAHAEDRAPAGASYRVGDMRDLDVGGEHFDAVTLLSGSFGFFDDETNLSVLQGMAAALESGGRMLLDCVAPAPVMRPRRRSWEHVAGGYLLMESRFDPVACVLKSDFRFIDEHGIINVAEHPERIRVYTLPEMKGLLAAAGLEFVAAHGGHELPTVRYDDRHADRLVVIARRPR